MIGCESLPLSCVHSNEYEVLRFCHIMREKEVLRDLIRPIDALDSQMALQILAVITP